MDTNLKELKFSIKLDAYKNSFNFLGIRNTTDKYIVVDKNEMDVTGEKFTKKEAQQICKELNK